MVKFSVSGKKRRRKGVTSSFSFCFSSDDEDAGLHCGEEEEDVRTDGENKFVAEEGGSSSCSGKHRIEDSITVRIDPDVLDCSICFDPLAPPIFQCNNGHIACSNCCVKMKNRCHSCSCSIGTSRCLAVEKILESIKITCPYAQDGCQKSVVYGQSNAHKETCTYSPCSCPFPDCNFEGSVQQLSLHCSTKHKGSVIFFECNSPFFVSLDRSKPFKVLHGSDGVLYFLHNNNCVSVGCFITLTAIHPGIRKGGMLYELIARSGRSSLELKSSLLNTKRWTGVSPSKGFLLVPHDFFDGHGILNLKIYIHNGQHVTQTPICNFVPYPTDVYDVLMMLIVI